MPRFITDGIRIFATVMEEEKPWRTALTRGTPDGREASLRRNAFAGAYGFRILYWCSRFAPAKAVNIVFPPLRERPDELKRLRRQMRKAQKKASELDKQKVNEQMNGLMLHDMLKRDLRRFEASALAVDAVALLYELQMQQKAADDALTEGLLEVEIDDGGPEPERLRLWMSSGDGGLVVSAEVEG